jgi:hypothetical protein
VFRPVPLQCGIKIIVPQRRWRPGQGGLSFNATRYILSP